MSGSFGQSWNWHWKTCSLIFGAQIGEKSGLRQTSPASLDEGKLTDENSVFDEEIEPTTEKFELVT